MFIQFYICCKLKQIFFLVISSNKPSHFSKGLVSYFFRFNPSLVPFQEHDAQWRTVTHSDAQWRTVTLILLGWALGRYVAVAGSAALAAAAAAQLASSQRNVQSTLEYINFWSFAHNQASSSSSTSSPHLQTLTFKPKLLFYGQFTQTTDKVGGRANSQNIPAKF